MTRDMRIFGFSFAGALRTLLVSASITCIPLVPGIKAKQVVPTSDKSAIPSTGAVVYRNVMIRMRDGVELATDVYLPDDGAAGGPHGRYPVVLERTPYDKAKEIIPPGAVETFIERGYAVVIQDVRGTHRSGGVFDPMMDEGWGKRRDGVDTLAWLVGQPWCDGRVGTIGMSYLGGVQVEVALAGAPGHVAAFIEAPATDQFRNGWVYRDGMLDFQTALPWAMFMGQDAAAHLPPAGRTRPLSDYQTMGGIEWEDGKSVFGFPPTQSLRDIKGVRYLPFWQAWLDHAEDPWYFRNNDTAERFQDVSLPIYLLGGWYDPFLRNTYEIYQAVTSQAKDVATRTNARLLIGPWSHSPCSDCENLPGANVDDTALSAAWLDRWVKGTSDSILRYPVILYVMGENRWRAEQAWPLHDAAVTSYYLHSAGHANTSAGDGALSPIRPQSEPADRYDYDPINPVPSRSDQPFEARRGRMDQSMIEHRSDVLVFTTPPLPEDVEVTGPLRMSLYAASSASDTDWHVKLVDVSTTGEAFNIASGAVRARYRHSRTAPRPLIPDAIESYEIDLWATSNVFKRGHRIRIEIASSDFPNLNRHPNRFIDLSRATAKDFVTAHQMIVHDWKHPSHIDLPIIPATHRRDWIPTPFPATGSKQAYPSLGSLPALPLKEAPGENLGSVPQ
jgi:uncharacterized protein